MDEQPTFWELKNSKLNTSNRNTIDRDARQ